MARGTLVTSLIGNIVKPGIVEWQLQPNLNGEKFGKIVAAWIDSDGHLAITVKGPHGDTWQTWITHVIIFQE